MIGDNPPLFLAHNPVLLLFSDKHNLYRFKEILLANYLPAMFDRIDSSLIDHIGKI